MNIIFYACFILLGIYTFIILSFAYGWNNIRFFKPEKEINNIPVTIIVACRNEETKISYLLKSLLHQDYPTQYLEIIFIDDHSEDDTVQVIKSFPNKNIPIKLLSLPNHFQGKKAAIELGVIHATGEIIITTDADCTMRKQWVKTMVAYHHKHKAKIISAPVIFKGNTLFEKLQALEFLSLMGTGAGAIGIKHPIMNNGANFLFEKKLFTTSALNKKFASGDDIFLLLQVKKNHKRNIHFIKSNNAVVYTKPASNLKDFLNQRIRWASKSKGYKDFDVISTALIISLGNLTLAGSLIYSCFNYSFFFIYLPLFIIKSFADLMVLIPVSRFTAQQKLLWFFVPLQFVYPFYIVITAAFGLLGKFRWKSRIYKEKR